MTEQLKMYDNKQSHYGSLEFLYKRKNYAHIDDSDLLMLHRALCHKMLTTDPDLLGPEYDVRLKEVADEMLRRVIESGVELVP